MISYSRTLSRPYSLLCCGSMGLVHSLYTPVYRDIHRSEGNPCPRSWRIVMRDDSRSTQVSSKSIGSGASSVMAVLSRLVLQLSFSQASYTAESPQHLFTSEESAGVHQTIPYANLRQPGGCLSGQSHPFLMRPSRASPRGPADLQLSHTLETSSLLAVAPPAVEGLLAHETSPIPALSALFWLRKTHKD